MKKFDFKKTRENQPTWLERIKEEQDNHDCHYSQDGECSRQCVRNRVIIKSNYLKLYDNKI